MELKLILEAILFSAQKPLSIKEIREVFAVAPDHAEGDEFVRGLKKVKEDDLNAALEQLAKDHEEAKRSYRLVCVAGSWQFVTDAAYAPWLKALVGHRARPPRLSAPGLETLTIIAYRQPITRAEIEQVRGVAVDGVMQTLLERGLVEQAGRAEVIGRPMTYATTPLFLEYFGLRSLEDLPAADELRRIVVEKPAALETADAAPEPQAQAQSPKSEVQSQEAAAAENPATTQEAGSSVPERGEGSEGQESGNVVAADVGPGRTALPEEPATAPAADAPQSEAPAPKKARKSRSKAKAVAPEAASAPAESAGAEPAHEVKEPDETAGTPQGD